MKGGVYIGRENVLVFVCGLLVSSLRRLTNSPDSNVGMLYKRLARFWALTTLRVLIRAEHRLLTL